MNRILTLLLTALTLLTAVPVSLAQAMFFNHARLDEQLTDSIEDGRMSLYEIDSIVGLWTPRVDPLPDYFFMPAVYDHYKYRHPLDISHAPVAIPAYNGRQQTLLPDSMPWFDWIVEANNTARLGREMEYDLFYNHPQIVRYNMATLPEPPKMYHTVIDPRTLQFEIREFDPKPAVDAIVDAIDIKKRHWIHSFNASLQFSQAYVSPNWYQGGNNNLNTIAQLNWNVKLNQKYHPNLLFEANTQYKLGLNNAPDDSVHSYNISEDLLQFNSTFGLKASKKWYYSVTVQFKTQILNSYKKNSDVLRSAFLSPGELNVGLGMTYNTANARKTFTFDASVAPLSYNMRTCINNRMDETAYDIKPGHNSTHKFGSSAECKMKVSLTYNISLQSRLFAFTDYERIYGDWENTLVFEINRYLTTQLYVHMRYDSQTPVCDDPDWHKLQIKEILSLGFAYKFAI